MGKLKNETTEQGLRVNIAHIQENGLTIAGELSSTIFDIDGRERSRFSNPLKYKLQLGFVNTEAILVTGDVSTILNCKCDRCLSVYLHSLENHEVCHYLDIPVDGQVDLTENVREDILITFPQKFLCAQSCVGFCSGCGQNLNFQDCNCDKYNETFDVWSELDKLRI